MATDGTSFVLSRVRTKRLACQQMNDGTGVCWGARGMRQGHAAAWTPRRSSTKGAKAGDRGMHMASARFGGCPTTALNDQS